VKILKIAVIAPQPYIAIRGTSLANLRLARALADSGHIVHMITYPIGSAPAHPGVLVHRCRPIPFIRSVGIGFSAAKLLLDLSLAARAFRAINGAGFDCIHAVEEAVFIGIPLGRRNRIPVIYDMDSILSHEVGGHLIGGIPPVMHIVRAAERWAIRRSTIVLTISRAMADHVKLIDPAKDVVIVPDVPLGGSVGYPERARPEIPRDLRGRKVIVYAGSSACYQGLDLLVSAMRRVIARCPEAVLIVVGGDERDIKRLRRQAKTLGVMRNLLFLGKKPPEQVPDFLALADVLASPRRGGINPPGKVYTYMQSGKPIVATEIAAHNEVLSSETAVLVPPTPDGIADGILWALANPDLAAVRASGAREKVRGMTPETQARRILAVYERLGGAVADRVERPLAAG